MANKMTDAEKKAAAEKRAKAKADKDAKAAAEKAAADDDKPNALPGGEGAGSAGVVATASGPAPATEPEVDDGPMISVRTARGVKSRRRGGRAFGPEPVKIPMADLSDVEVEVLDADPALLVELVE